MLSCHRVTIGYHWIPLDTYMFWLVVWNMFSYFSICWECHHPNCFIFFRGVGIPPTSVYVFSACVSSILLKNAIVEPAIAISEASENRIPEMGRADALRYVMPLGRDWGPGSALQPDPSFHQDDSWTKTRKSSGVCVSI